MATEPEQPAAQPEQPARPPFTDEEKAAGFSSSHTKSLPRLLKSFGASLLVTTYQSGRLIVCREQDETLNTHFRIFEGPMGVAIDRQRLVVGTRRYVWDYRNQPAVARRVEPAGPYDAVYLPRSFHVTGDIRVHEVAFAGDGAWFVNTLFSCLCTLDADHSFVPQWRPPFVTALAPEDRCHLNGLGMVDGRPRYVSALAATDTAGGWRDHKADGGLVYDLEADQVIVDGLCMPHSPRWNGGRLWILESGKGSLGRIDPATGAVETVAELPGFTRGLAFAGPFAFVGLSQVRETLFEGVPIVERAERACGVWVVDTRSGEIIGFVRFEGIVQEIFDVQVVGFRFPEVGLSWDRTRTSTCRRPGSGDRVS